MFDEENRELNINDGTGYQTGASGSNYQPSQQSQPSQSQSDGAGYQMGAGGSGYPQSQSQTPQVSQQQPGNAGYQTGASGSAYQPSQPSQQQPDGTGYQMGAGNSGYPQQPSQQPGSAGYPMGVNGSVYPQQPQSGGTAYQPGASGSIHQQPGNAGYQAGAAGNGYQPGLGAQPFQADPNQTNGDQKRNGGSEPHSGRKPKEKKKKSGIVKKTAGIVAAALLFGVISGGTMVGVNILADSMKEDETTAATVPQPTERVTLSDEELNKIASQLKLDTGSGTATVTMDVSGIVENAMPSVVAINNTALYQSRNPWFGGTQTYEVPSAGSGIIVGKNDTELLIATNDHVIEDATKLSVVFIDDQEVQASIKGNDSESDLAIVSVLLTDIPSDTLSKISIAELGNSDELKIGQGVIAIGNALGYGQAVTVGYVSAVDRQVTTGGVTRSLLQTDAAINPGNSGGALLNMQGQVVGINEAKYSDTDVEGMGFAIPISQAQDILDSLMVRRSGEKVDEDEAGYLGIQGTTVDSTMIQQFDMPAGVYVYRIVEGGAAASTDLREKDIIVALDGQKVTNMATLENLLQYYKKGETVEMVVKSLEYGEYVERTITITLGGKVDNG